jgi:hypothetical protein
MNHLNSRLRSKRQQMRRAMKSVRYLMHTRAALLDGRLKKCLLRGLLASGRLGRPGCYITSAGWPHSGTRLNRVLGGHAKLAMVSPFRFIGGLYACLETAR